VQEISGQQLSEQRYLQRLEEEEFGDSKISKVQCQPVEIEKLEISSIFWKQ